MLRKNLVGKHHSKANHNLLDPTHKLSFLSDTNASLICKGTVSQESLKFSRKTRQQNVYCVIFVKEHH